MSHSKSAIQDIRDIRAVLRGDTHAYAQLVSRYQNMAFSLAVGIVKNSEDAEEVVQDAFVKAFISLKKFREDSRFSTWFYKIVYRTALTASAKRMRFAPISTDDITVANQEKDEYSPALEDEISHQEVHAVLSLLNEKERTVLTLYYLQEHNVEEVSEILSAKASVIKMWLYRARATFAQKYNELYVNKLTPQI